MALFLGAPRLMWAGRVARDGPVKLVKEEKARQTLLSMLT